MKEKRVELVAGLLLVDSIVPRLKCFKFLCLVEADCHSNKQCIPGTDRIWRFDGLPHQVEDQTCRLTQSRKTMLSRPGFFQCCLYQGCDALVSINVVINVVMLWSLSKLWLSGLYRCCDAVVPFYRCCDALLPVSVVMLWSYSIKVYMLCSLSRLWCSDPC